MEHSSGRRDRQHLARGFTLIEAMIVVAIAGILAAIAFPSFMQQVRQGRRTDAMDVIARVQQAQERWRANNATYAPLSSLGIASTSPNGYYTITSDAATGAGATSGYTVTATAVGSKSQASDTGCSTLTLTVSGGTPAYTPATCWKR